MSQRKQATGSLILPDDGDEDHPRDESNGRHQEFISPFPAIRSGQENDSMRSRGTYEVKDNPESRSSLKRMPNKEPPSSQRDLIWRHAKLDQSEGVAPPLAHVDITIPRPQLTTMNGQAIMADEPKSTDSTMSDVISLEFPSFSNAFLIPTDGDGDHRNDDSLSAHAAALSILDPSSLSTLTKSSRRHGRLDGSEGFRPRFSNPESVQPSAMTSSSPGDTQKALGHPRKFLNERYQKQQISIQNRSTLVTFSDNTDGDHVPKWSAIFVCPKTREAFLSGDLLDDSVKGARFYRDRNGVNWYGRVKQAECAAAGRAEDCFRFREGSSRQESGVRYQFCQERPYSLDEAITALPRHIPKETVDKVRRLKG